MSWDVLTDRGLEFSNKLIVTTKVVTIFALVFLVYSAEPHWSISNSVVKRYKSTKILGGGPPGKIVQCQSFQTIIPLISQYFIFLFARTLVLFRIGYPNLHFLLLQRTSYYCILQRMLKKRSKLGHFGWESWKIKLT